MVGLVLLAVSWEEKGGHSCCDEGGTDKQKMETETNELIEVSAEARAYSNERNTIKEKARAFVVHTHSPARYKRSARARATKYERAPCAH